MQLSDLLRAEIEVEAQLRQNIGAAALAGGGAVAVFRYRECRPPPPQRRTVVLMLKVPDLSPPVPTSIEQIGIDSGWHLVRPRCAWRGRCP